MLGPCERGGRLLCVLGVGLEEVRGVCRLHRSKKFRGRVESEEERPPLESAAGLALSDHSVDFHSRHPAPP